jgi:hypothetical protein
LPLFLRENTGKYATIGENVSLLSKCRGKQSKLEKRRANVQLAPKIGDRSNYLLL